METLKELLFFMGFVVAVWILYISLPVLQFLFNAAIVVAWTIGLLFFFCKAYDICCAVFAEASCGIRATKGYLVNRLFAVVSFYGLVNRMLQDLLPINVHNSMKEELEEELKSVKKEHHKEVRELKNQMAHKETIHEQKATALRKELTEVIGEIHIASQENNALKTEVSKLKQTVRSANVNHHRREAELQVIIQERQRIIEKLRSDAAYDSAKVTAAERTSTELKAAKDRIKVLEQRLVERARQEKSQAEEFLASRVDNLRWNLEEAERARVEVEQRMKKNEGEVGKSKEKAEEMEKMKTSHKAAIRVLMKNHMEHLKAVEARCRTTIKEQEQGKAEEHANLLKAKTEAEAEATQLRGQLSMLKTQLERMKRA